MTFDEFKSSLSAELPPENLSLALQGLWFDGKGNWDQAHQCAQDQDDQTGAWVHAYLHRKEGDLGNASYWYRRANKAVKQGSLEDEWENIVSSLL